MITVYRGIAVRQDTYESLVRSVGKNLKLTHHPWWATVERVARVYATTDPVHTVLHPQRIVLKAHLLGFDAKAMELYGQDLPPTLPNLLLFKKLRLTLNLVEVYNV